MTGIPERSTMLLTIEALTGRLTGITKRIPKESFDKIIDGIHAKDFFTKFDFDRSYDSVGVWEDFETFSVESDGDGYLVMIDLKVNYEVLRGEVVNDVAFSIDELTVYDNEGDEMVIDHVQADQIKQAVESKNYKS